MDNTNIIFKLCNGIMLKGRKHCALRLLSQILFFIQLDSREPTSFVLYNSLRNIRPLVSIKYKRFGRYKYPIPISLKPTASNNLAVKWLLQESRLSVTKRPIARSISLEILYAASNSGKLIKRRNKLYKLVLIGRAYIRFK